MSNSWIGNIILSQEDSIKTDSGEKVFDLLTCDGSVVDESLHPILAETVGYILPTMASLDANTPYKIIADKT